MNPILGDCVEVMAGMDAASVDAIVTDPPYGLEFMGKAWDRQGQKCKPMEEAIERADRLLRRRVDALDRRLLAPEREDDAR